MRSTLLLLATIASALDVRGGPSSILSAPWQVLVSSCVQPENCVKCGGILVDNRWVLTAADCISGEGVRAIWVVGGTAVAPSASGVQWSVVEAQLHGNLALLQLSDAVSGFHRGLSVIAMDDGSAMPAVGQEVLVSGWTTSNASRSHLLHVGELVLGARETACPSGRLDCQISSTATANCLIGRGAAMLSRQKQTLLGMVITGDYLCNPASAGVSFIPAATLRAWIKRTLDSRTTIQTQSTTSAALSLPTAGPMVFSPAANSIVATGTKITITSAHTENICISWAFTPGCKFNAFGCAFGSSIFSGQTTPTPSDSPVFLRAQACGSSGFADTNSVMIAFTTPGLPGTPVLAPGAGTGLINRKITITSTQESAICWRADGTNPACNSAKDNCASGSTRWSTAAMPVISDSPITVKAIACKPAGASPITSAIYTITAQAPVASPVTDTILAKGTKITLTSEGALFLCYATDGKGVTCGTTGCTKGIKQTSTVFPKISDSPYVVQVTGCRPDGISSAMKTFTYTTTGLPPAPTFDPAATDVPTGTKITIISAEASAICWTIDGSAPSCNTAKDGCLHGTEVNDGVANNGPTITVALKLRVISCKPAGISTVVSQQYTIAVAPPKPSAAPASGTTVAANTLIALTSSGSTAICWTTTSATPACTTAATGCATGSTLATTKPSVTGVTTVKAVACKNVLGTLFTSAIATLSFAVVPSTPTVSPFVGGVPPATALTFTSTGSAVICYTDDGTTPVCNGAATGCTAGSTPAATAPSVDFGATNFKVVGCVSLLGAAVSSSVATFTYTISVTPPPDPTFNPASLSALPGSGATSYQIISDGSSLICYTTDGSDPSCQLDGTACSTGLSTTSATDINLSNGLSTGKLSIKAKACKVGNSSNVVSALYFPAVAYNPVAGTTFSTCAGVASSIAMSAASFTGTICYTTDGSSPVCSGSSGCTAGTAYTASISITATTTLNVVQCDGAQQSAVQTATFTVTAIGNPPVPSITDFFGGGDGSTESLSTGPYYTVMSTSDIATYQCIAYGSTSPVCNIGSTSCSAGTKISKAESYPMGYTTTIVQIAHAGQNFIVNAVACGACGSSSVNKVTYKLVA